MKHVGENHNDDKHNKTTFKFSSCIITVNHFYLPTNALNYTKFRG